MKSDDTAQAPKSWDRNRETNCKEEGEHLDNLGQPHLGNRDSNPW